MSKVYCIFCNKEMEKDPYLYPLSYSCKNHKNIEVIFNYCGALNMGIIIKNTKYKVLMDVIKYKAVLSIPSESYMNYVPYDFNLTPDNFEQKIKTYLNFQ